MAALHNSPGSPRGTDPARPSRIIQLAGSILALLVLLSGCGSSEQTGAPLYPRDPLRAQRAVPGRWLFVPDQPPCQHVQNIYQDYDTVCIELVVDQPSPSEAVPALRGLAFAPDGTLYAARTAWGEIWALRDADGDHFMDAPTRAAGGLRLPLALTAHDGALFVLTVDQVIRLDDPGADGVFQRQTVLVEGLEGARGVWPGSIGIGPDGRLYISLGAACDPCDDPADQTGRLVSYALDGGDPRLEATGLRDPADFAWDPNTGNLWIADSGRIVPPNGLDGPPDELNRFTPGADYGFPLCYADRAPDPLLANTSADRCAVTIPPALTFDYQSSPSGLAFYPHTAFPFWQGGLIIAMRGSWNLPEPVGYWVGVLNFSDGQPNGTYDVIAPAREGAYDRQVQTVYSLARKGFFPYHPADIAVSPDGWIYLAVEEGRIYRFRPNPA